jgi:amino acid transporter
MGIYTSNLKQQSEVLILNPPNNSTPNTPSDLAKGALNSAETIVMGIAGTAPAFSVAVTTSTIVAAVGELAIGSIVYCGLIMFGIMLAFTHLNKTSPNAGASYSWVGQVFGRSWGFLRAGACW